MLLQYCSVWENHEPLHGCFLNVFVFVLKKNFYCKRFCTFCAFWKLETVYNEAAWIQSSFSLQRSVSASSQKKKRNVYKSETWVHIYFKITCFARIQRHNTTKDRRYLLSCSLPIVNSLFFRASILYSFHIFFT